MSAKRTAPCHSTIATPDDSTPARKVDRPVAVKRAAGKQGAEVLPPRVDAVIAHDCARGGWGWAVVRGDQVVDAHWVATKHLGHPWASLAQYMAEVYAPAVRAEMERGTVAVICETPGAHATYYGPSAATVIALGVGLGVGPVLMTSAGLTGQEPETTTPKEWRATWKIRGKRDVCKATAVRLAGMLCPGLTVQVADWRGGLSLAPTAFADLTDAQREDVAEAVLIGMGRSRQGALDPRHKRG